MALLRVIILLISIYIAAIQAENGRQLLNQPLVINCGKNGHVEITKAEYKVLENSRLQPKQKKIFEALPKEREITLEVKRLCQFKGSCRLEFAFRVQVVYLDVDYTCKTTRCPHPKFLEKHMVRRIGDASDEAVIETLVADRTRYHWQPTDKVDFFIDPKDFMKYHNKVGNECVFNTAAEKISCNTADRYKWKCQRDGSAIVTHSTESGHYDWRKNVPVTTGRGGA